jgi:hypothetical protein
MAKTTFTLRVPGLDVTDVEGCRNTLIGIIGDPEFETYVRGFELSRVSLGGATPVPRGGEIGMGCHIESGGGWGCDVHGGVSTGGR